MTAFLTVFATVFLAELGDKTQLATILFSSDDGRSKIMVFIAASTALIVSTGAATLLGAAADRYFAILPLKLLAGIGFVIMGVVMVAEHIRTA